MANVKTKRHKNALKAYRKSLKRESANRGIKIRIHKRIKEFKNLLSHKNFESAAKMLPELYSIIDKAAKTNTIHWKNAARKKSEISKLLKKSLGNQQ
ncbi:MAG: 30S ribosomal protein S20 [Elusimicrobiota bacterium]